MGSEMCIRDRSMERISHCTVCRDFTEVEVCRICSDATREREKLCIVESPSDLAALEKATDYRGLYFVLHGKLSPLDGIGPEMLGLEELTGRFESGTVREVILATNSTVEGEATAHYVGEMARARQLSVMRIAHGVPLGGELEYVDGGTLSHAFAGRTPI